MGCAWLLGKPRTLEDRLRERRTQLTATKLHLRRQLVAARENKMTAFHGCIDATMQNDMDRANRLARQALRHTKTLQLLEEGQVAIDDILGQLDSVSAGIDLGGILSRHAHTLHALNGVLQAGSINYLMGYIQRQSAALDQKTDVRPAKNDNDDAGVKQLLVQARRLALNRGDGVRIELLEDGSEDVPASSEDLDHRLAQLKQL